MNFFSLAAKNLMRRRGRTTLTVLGVAIAVSVLISLLALNSGYEKELSKEVNSMGVHILAVPKGGLSDHPRRCDPQIPLPIRLWKCEPDFGCGAGHAHAPASVYEEG